MNKGRPGARTTLRKEVSPSDCSKVKLNLAKAVWRKGYAAFFRFLERQVLNSSSISSGEGAAHRTDAL